MSTGRVTHHEIEASVAAARQDRRTAKADKADEGEAADEAKAAVATKAPPKRRRKTA